MASRVEQRKKAREARLQREAEERARAARKRRMWQLGAVLGVAVAIVIIAVVVSTTGGSSSKPKAKPSQITSLFAGIPQHGINLGDPKAPVTVTEFADLKCPVCQAYTLSVQPDVISRYVRTGRVKIVFRNVAFVGNSIADTQAAARAAGAAGLQNKLYNFADTFYNNQQDELTTYVTDAFVTKIARKVPGLNVQKLLADRSSPQVNTWLTQAASLANKFGVNGTPTFIVQRGNAQPVKVTDYTQLENAINSQLAGT